MAPSEDGVLVSLAHAGIAVFAGAGGVWYNVETGICNR